MQEGQAVERIEDAETSFRRRLGEKLAARGYSGAALAEKIEELLRRDIPLRLRPEDFADPTGS